MIRKTDRERGREILRAQSGARDAATLDGVKPRKGLWVVHPETGSVYGQITQVWDDGRVRLRGKLARFNVQPEKLINGGYRYRAHARMEGVTK